VNDPLLEARSLAKAFPSPEGPITVLSQVDFSISAQESVSIRGESGAGKSTLLYLLTLLEAPDSGELLWRGEPVLNKSIRAVNRLRAKLLGFVFQSFYLMPELNALENVLIAKRMLGGLSSADKTKAEGLLKRVGLEKRLNALPTTLSGGERQRVAIARALMNNPDIIVADEPTGNLDEHTAEQVMDMLLGLCKEEGTALILVTHNPSFASCTNRQLFLQHGAL
tara:strand:- start:44203 stop:44874 length:672 start_codon:yes stop_codon:yes gene_type:complete